MDQAFGSFAEAETPRLIGLAFAMTGDKHDAWDLVQETLVRVGVRWQRLRYEEPAGYARTVMTRLNIDRLRRLRRELPVARVYDTSAHAVHVTGEVDAWLVDALQGLSPRQRTALALRFVEDLDVAHVAARMGCSVGTAKSHLSRGMAKLREKSPNSDRYDSGKVSRS